MDVLYWHSFNNSIHCALTREVGKKEGNNSNSQYMDHHAIARDDSQKVYCESCYQQEIYA